MNKAKQFHEMTTEELQGKHNALKNELFNLRFQHTTGQLSNHVMIRTVKKDIARVLTVLRERELNISAAKPAKVTKGGNK